MEENNRKDFDVFLRKAVKEVGLYEPSKDFNRAILSKLSLKAEQQSIKNKPLISNFGWLLVGIIVISVVVTTIFYTQEPKTNNAYQTIWDKLLNFNFFDKIPNIAISEIFTYGILGLLVFLYIQLFLFKKYLNTNYVV